jgi:hypothetical protein
LHITAKYKVSTLTTNLIKMEKLTEQDLDTLRYFWQEKEDLERFTDFEKLKPLLEKEKPEVLKAWNDYKTSKKILDIVMDNIC